MPVDTSKLRCPACGGTGAFVVSKAQVPNYEYSNSIVPLTLTAHYGETGESGLFGAPVKKRSTVGLRARVCRSCGHVSWFVRELDRLAEFAEKGHGGVREER